MVGDPPSLKHPTLELRAPDSCTLVDDSIAIAALYRTLARHLTRNPWQNWDLTAVTRAIVVENKWRAQRYGVHGTFVDISGNGAISVAEMLDSVLEEVERDALALGCLQGSAALPHHRRQRHLGRHAACGVRAGAGPQREPRRRAARRHRLDRRGDAAIAVCRNGGASDAVRYLRRDRSRFSAAARFAAAIWPRTCASSER